MNINKERILEKTKTKISISDFINDQNKITKKINIIKQLDKTIIINLNSS